MNILWSGAVIFIAFLAIHLIIWRIGVPKNGVKALLSIFFGVLITALIIIITGSVLFGGLKGIYPEGILEYLHLCLFCVALVLSYIVTYTAIEADSPSVAIILKIAGSGNAGLPKKDLDLMLTDEVLVKPRIADLLIDGMISFNNGLYTVTVKGMLFTQPFILYRRLLGLEKGG